MKRQKAQHENTENNLNSQVAPSARDIAKRATTTTERLCHLYVTITQNMDPSLVRYYLQHDKVRKLFKRSSKPERPSENKTTNE